MKLKKLIIMLVALFTIFPSLSYAAGSGEPTVKEDHEFQGTAEIEGKDYSYSIVDEATSKTVTFASEDGEDEAVAVYDKKEGTLTINGEVQERDDTEFFKGMASGSTVEKQLSPINSMEDGGVVTPFSEQYPGGGSKWTLIDVSYGSINVASGAAWVCAGILAVIPGGQPIAGAVGIMASIIGLFDNDYTTVTYKTNTQYRYYAPGTKYSYEWHEYKHHTYFYTYSGSYLNSGTWYTGHNL